MSPAGLVLGLALLQAAAPGVQQKPADILAARVETGFRACALQLTGHDYLAAKNEAALKVAGIALGGEPPADARSVAARLFPADAVFASIGSPEGKFWVAASATVPVCKLLVSNSAYALTARYNWSTKLRGTAGWTWDRRRSGMQGNFMRDLFVLYPDRPGAHMIVILDGPNVVLNEGVGTQMIMTVTLDPAKAP